MPTATASKPMTFRRWYNGNLFAESSAWATDGRLMVRLDAVRTKGPRAAAAKRDTSRVPYADSDAKASHVIAGASKDTWTSLPRHIGALFHAAGYVDTRFGCRPYDVPERDYAVVCADREHGGMPILYEPVALAWMIEHIRWSALRLDPVRSSLWMVDVDGLPIALLMPIAYPADPTPTLSDELVKRWAEVQP